MFWDNAIPKVRLTDAQGLTTNVTVIAGQIEGRQALKPPPKSWAADERSDVAIMVIKMEAGASWTLPQSASGTQRALYVIGPGGLSVAGQSIAGGHQLILQPDTSIPLTAVDKDVELLLLQGRPIGEPVPARPVRYEHQEKSSKPFRLSSHAIRWLALEMLHRFMVRLLSASRVMLTVGQISHRSARRARRFWPHSCGQFRIRRSIKSTMRNCYRLSIG